MICYFQTRILAELADWNAFLEKELKDLYEEVSQLKSQLNRASCLEKIKAEATQLEIAGFQETNRRSERDFNTLLQDFKDLQQERNQERQNLCRRIEEIVLEKIELFSFIFHHGKFMKCRVVR